VSESSVFQIGMAIVELKSYKLQRIDKIPAEIIRIGSTTSAEIRKIINYIYKMNELLTLKEDVLNHCYKLHTTLHPKFSYQFLSHIEKKNYWESPVCFSTQGI